MRTMSIRPTLARVRKHCNQRFRKLNATIRKITTMIATITPAMINPTVQASTGIWGSAAKRERNMRVSRDRYSNGASLQQDGTVPSRGQSPSRDKIGKLLKIGCFQAAQIGLVHRANDDFAGFNVHATDPLARFDHHALGDRIDAPAVEVGDPRGSQRRHGPSESA